MKGTQQNIPLFHDFFSTAYTEKSLQGRFGPDISELFTRIEYYIKALILQTINAGEAVKERAPSDTVGENVRWYSYYGEQALNLDIFSTMILHTVLYSLRN